QSRPLEILVVGAAALDEDVAVLARVLDRLLAEVEHEVVDARVAELVRDAPADPSEAADDVVVLEPFDHAPPPAFRPRTREDAAGDHLDDRPGDVEEDSHAGEEQEDREDLRAVAGRLRVDPGEGRRDDGAV